MESRQLIEILSGQNRSWVAVLLRGFLWMVTPVYGLAVCIRNALFRVGWRKVRRAALPVISLGNLTTGGTGKTPLVIWVAEHLRRNNVRVALLSRGYAALESGENDEARELARRLPDVPNLLDRDRFRSATIAAEELEMECLIMDDGFQHRQLHRDLEIVLIDALCPFGYGHLLPRGLLREPLRALGRADWVLITRADSVTEQRLQEIQHQILRYHPQVAVGRVAFQPVQWIQEPNRALPLDSLRDRPVAMLCGIGNPSGFRTTLQACGVNVMAECLFADHHPFTDDDLQSVQRIAEQAQAEAVVCTVKDLVKIQRGRLGNLPLLALEIAAEVTEGDAALRDRLDQVVAQSRGEHTG